MFRTSVYENSKQGGLHITARDQELRQAYRHTIFFERSWQWGSWYERAAVTQMQALRRDLRQFGISLTGVENAITRGASAHGTRLRP